MKRVWQAASSSPRSIILAVFGLTAFVTGILLRDEGVGMGLLVVGAGLLTFGVLFPVVQESQIGPGGFTLKTVREARDADFVPFAEGQRERLQRLAYLLTGDTIRAADLVADSLARAYVDWARIYGHHRGFYLVCTVVRLSLGAGALGLAGPPVLPEDAEAPGLAAGVEALLSLPAQLRTVALLHHYEGLDDLEIGRIVDARPQEVQARLREAESRLMEAHPSAAGS